MTEILHSIQKHIFLIALGAAVFLGFSLAYLSGTMLEYFFQPAVTAPPQTAVRSRPVESKRRFVPFKEYEKISSGALIRGPDISIGAAAPGAGLKQEETPAPQTNITLLGTISGSPSFARAAIQLEGKSDVESFKVGDSPGGYKILSIHSKYIRVKSGAAVIKIQIGKKSENGGTVPRPGVSVAAKGGRVRKSSISRTEFQRLLNNEKDLMKGMNIVPFNYQGKMAGLRVRLLSPNHVFYKLGARPGDIIRRFNGGKLDSTGKLVQIYTDLKSPSLKKASVTVERSNQLLTYEFVITD